MNYWALIEHLGWGKKTTEYNDIKDTLMTTYTKEEVNGLRNFIKGKVALLSESVDRFVEKNPEAREKLPYGGDDSFGDMVYHAIGLGKETYESALKDPMTLAKLKPVESFAYAIPYPNDYKEDTYKHFQLCARKYLDQYSAEGFDRLVNNYDSNSARTIKNQLEFIANGNFSQIITEGEAKQVVQRLSSDIDALPYKVAVSFVAIKGDYSLANLMSSVARFMARERVRTGN
jgi:hypothetical protein